MERGEALRQVGVGLEGPQRERAPDRQGISVPVERPPGQAVGARRPVGARSARRPRRGSRSVPPARTATSSGGKARSAAIASSDRARGDEVERRPSSTASRGRPYRFGSVPRTPVFLCEEPSRTLAGHAFRTRVALQHAVDPDLGPRRGAARVPSDGRLPTRRGGGPGIGGADLAEPRLPPGARVPPARPEPDRGTPRSSTAVLHTSKPTIYRHINKLKALDLLEEVVGMGEGKGRKGYRVRYGNMARSVGLHRGKRPERVTPVPRDREPSADADRAARRPSRRPSVAPKVALAHARGGANEAADDRRGPRRSDRRSR